ncbi:MAG TPA: FAD-dependent oxidoreductase [Castellaniella sp.]|uniref:FAD-dependent oxidoreductase n=1 Tax=Castellaniella sp. TaxID=1955812 RepID=UPI002F126DE2
MQIGIAGAGVLGRLLAWCLSREGHAVTVIDPASGPLGRGAAGWTAAGMLSPSAELECADLTVFQAGLDSIGMWGRIIASLPGAPDFDCHGSLLLAHRGDEGAAHHLVDLIEHKAPEGHRPQSMTIRDLTRLEPDIHGPAHAWMLPHEGAVNPVQLMQALCEGASGVHWLWNQSVDTVASGLLQTRDASSHKFDHVFDVRGLGQRPADGPGSGCAQVRGVRGEIFLLHAPEVALKRPIRLLHPRHRVYIVPRRDHHYIVGASEIESEDRSPVSLRTTVELLSAAYSVLPGLAEARLIHTETNLRPALPDNLPLIEQAPGLTRINGLFRHGWMIAPAMVTKALHGARIPAELAPAPAH